MFYSLGRLAAFCFGLVSSCFQLFATFGCSAHHHQDYQQHNRTSQSSSQQQQQQQQQPPSLINGKVIYDSSGKHQRQNGYALNGFYQNGGHSNQTTTAKTRSKCAQKTIQTTQTATGGKYCYDERLRPKIPLHMLISNFVCLSTLMFYGYLNDFLRKIGLLESFEHTENNRDGYTKLYNTFQPFYIRNIIQRMIDMWGHPLCSVPRGCNTKILERKFDAYNTNWKFTGRTLTTINMGSYDYLGHSQNFGSRIDAVLQTIDDLGVSVQTTPNELGSYEMYRELEKKVAKYLGTEDAIVIGMGFATNSLCLPSFFGPGSLVISDECNHASLALGCKLSGAKIHVFKHNNMQHLEKIIREALIKGQPGTGEPWKKIVILVEGIYSMEGTIVNLPELIRIKKKYRSYVYMDEAHSIGAMGDRGRGICDYFGCDPRDVDILMGTFTKSFAAAGGYVAGKKHTIDYIRTNSAGFFYGCSMSPPICRQISVILDSFLSMDSPNQRSIACSNNSSSSSSSNNNFGEKTISNRIAQLRRNVTRFRQKLKQLGFHIDGNDDSPVVPLLVYTPPNLKCLIKKLLQKGIASTGASFPVTSLTTSRARFCLSADHNDKAIDYVLKCLDEIGTEIGLKFDADKIRRSSTDHHHHHHLLHHPHMNDNNLKNSVGFIGSDIGNNHHQYGTNNNIKLKN